MAESRTAIARALAVVNRGAKRVARLTEARGAKAAAQQDAPNAAKQDNAAAKVGVASCGWAGYLVEPASEMKLLGSDALEKLVRDFEFETVLDLGAGAGHHTRFFRDAGKAVTAVDMSRTPNFEPDIIGDFMNMDVGVHDCVWCCHVLEHVPAVQPFLVRLLETVREGGFVAITVPPAKHEIVGGHITLWNAGLLLYNLILAGLDCSEASVKTYGYNVSVIVRKKSIVPVPVAVPFRELDRYFPVDAPPGFDGRIVQLNW